MSMNINTLSLLGTAAAMMIAGTASASFLNVNVGLHTTWTNNGTDYDVYRLYANFSAPGNVTFWGGQFDGELNIFTVGGTGFYQSNFASSALPQPAHFLYEYAQDEFDHSSYMTLGVTAGYTPDEVGGVFTLTPYFNPVLGGNSSLTGIGGVISEPSAPNAQTDENNRVLLGQFTMLAGETIATAGGAGGVSTIHLVANGESRLVQIIPAPGALALLGLAGLFGIRRRRA